jgi:hypothetical protein
MMFCLLRGVFEARLILLLKLRGEQLLFISVPWAWLSRFCEGEVPRQP